MKDHKNLDVWRDSIDLVAEVYSISSSFPKDEVYGLTSQMRRSAVSIPSNIAEGAARQTEKEFIHFLYVASGSNAELETQLIIAKKLNFIQDIDCLQQKVVLVQKKLHGLIRHYKNKA